MINQVFNQCCLEGMQNIPSKSIDMILCDLPYGTTQNKWDAVIPFAPLWEQYERVIKENGAIVLTASQPFTSSLVMSNQKLFKYDIIWDKVVTTGFLNASKMPMRRHDHILIFYKSLPTFNPQRKKRSQNSHSLGRPENYTKSLGVTPQSNYGKINDTRKSERVDNLKCPDSIIEFSKGNGIIERFHPTQKPVALFEYLIKTYTNEGETVLDNCMGSGTTAIACINTNRNYIGFEKEKKYYEIIQERIKNHKPQLKLAI